MTLNKISYSLVVCIALLIVLITMNIIMNESDIEYDPMWKNLTIASTVLVGLYFLWILYMYMTYDLRSKSLRSNPPRYIEFLLFVSVSVFMICFGFATIHQDEIADSIPKNTFHYFFLNENNDNISVGAMLTGFIVIFLTCVDFFLVKHS